MDDMSNSYRKTPILPIASQKAGLEKSYKRKANRALRRATRVRLAQGNYDHLPRLRDISDVWAWPKDGKRWCNDLDVRWMRK